MLGPGKYDDLCTLVREAAEAEGALVVVVGGAKGPGFSCQFPPHLLRRIPEMLRIIADDIENSAEKDMQDGMRQLPH